MEPGDVENLNSNYLGTYNNVTKSNRNKNYI